MIKMPPSHSAGPNARCKRVTARVVAVNGSKALNMPVATGEM